MRNASQVLNVSGTSPPGSLCNNAAAVDKQTTAGAPPRVPKLIKRKSSRMPMRREIIDISGNWRADPPMEE
jgi:hypothetical protein